MTTRQPDKTLSLLQKIIRGCDLGHGREIGLRLCLGICLSCSAGFVVSQHALAQQQGQVLEEGAEQEQKKEEASEQEQEQEVVCSQEEKETGAAFLRAQRYLSRLPALQTRFVQYDVKGGKQEGLLRLMPPYRMRLDYDAPSGLRLYVNANEALHVDMKRKFVRQYPVIALPAIRMLQRIFAGKGSEALETTQVCIIEDMFVALRMRFRKKASRRSSQGYAELYFNKSPYQFLGWDLFDSGSGTTRIRLRELEATDAPKITTFRFEPPWVVKREK